jgi:carbon storage regulator CsrA
MLVLSRKVGEAIRIGNNVELFVVSVARGRVKLGFRAPLSTPIRRAEVSSDRDDFGGRAPPVGVPVPVVLDCDQPVREFATSELRVVGTL